VSASAKGAASIAVVEWIDQFVIATGILFRVDEMRSVGLVPDAPGGARDLRRLHEGFANIKERHLYHLGGGVKRDLALLRF